MAGKQRVRAAKRALYRQLVLEAAERVFGAEGYDDAKIDHIARASELSLGTVYAVFASKSEIFRAVHERHGEALLRAGLAPTRDVEDPLDALLAGVRGWTRYFAEHPDYLRMNLREGTTWGADTAGAQSRVRTQAWQRGVALLASALARCIDAGVIHAGDPLLFARMMIAMQQVQLSDWLEAGMPEPADALAERIAADVRRLFGVARPRAGAARGLRSAGVRGASRPRSTRREP